MKKEVKMQKSQSEIQISVEFNNVKLQNTSEKPKLDHVENMKSNHKTDAK